MLFVKICPAIISTYRRRESLKSRWAVRSWEHYQLARHLVNWQFYIIADERRRSEVTQLAGRRSRQFFIIKFSFSIAIKPNSRVWVLDRRAFQQIMMRTGLQRIEENVEFLKSVPLLKKLSTDVLCKIADVLELVSFHLRHRSTNYVWKCLCS